MSFACVLNAAVSERSAAHTMPQSANEPPTVAGVHSPCGDAAPGVLNQFRVLDFAIALGPSDMYSVKSEAT